MPGRLSEPPEDLLVELVGVEGDRGARAAERERRAEDGRETDDLHRLPGLFEAAHVDRARDVEAETHGP